MITTDILGERARLTPQKLALVYVPFNERFTYEQLNERAIRCASMWKEVCRLSKGDRAGILAWNCTEFLDAFFAAAKSGVVLVPLDVRLTSRELGFIIRDSGIKAILYDGHCLETVRELRQTVAVERWIAIGEQADPCDLSYRKVTATAAQLDSQKAVDLLPEDTCCILYTSGTTGKPKGVVIPHRMVVWNGYNTVMNWQLREDDVSSIFTPLHHAGGLGAFLVPIITIGGTIILHRSFDAGEVWRTIQKEQCTVVLGVPTIFKMLLQAPECETASLNHVRWFISGGAPLSASLIEDYKKRGIVLKQGYGLTEVGVNCFSMTTEEATRKIGSIGKPMMFTRARLVNSAGEDVPAGQEGELLLQGPHVSNGYWANPEATAAALDSQGWFRTGDLARSDEEGFFYIAGRLKEMYISGGINVYPAEIEGQLVTHSEVQDAAVIGVPDSTWGEIGVAFVVIQAGGSVTKEDLDLFLRERLAKYKVPKEIVFVQSLPRSAYGKVMKNELREHYLRSTQAKNAFHQQ